MAAMLILLLRIIGVSFGVFLIYTRLLYKTEQGKLQNRLEELWLRIEELQQSALTRHTAFMRIVAGAATSILDRIFGKKLISLQSITVSVCYAVASISFTFTLGIYLLGVTGSNEFIPIIIFYLFAGSFPALISLLVKGRLKQQRIILIWLSVLLTLAYVNIVMPSISIGGMINNSGDRYLLTMLIIFAVGVLIALALYSVFIMLSRLSFRKMATSNSLVRTGFISLLNVVPVLVLYGLFELTLLKFDYSSIDPNIDTHNTEQVKNVLTSWGNQLDMGISLTLVILFLMCSVFVIPALLFILLSLVMLIHRILWPLIQRPLYGLVELEIPKRNNIFLISGIILILLSLGLYSWIEAGIKLIL